MMTSQRFSENAPRAWICRWGRCEHTLRQGLSPALAEARPAYRVKLHPSGFRPGVDPLRLNRLNDSLEDAAFAGPLPE